MVEKRHHQRIVHPTKCLLCLNGTKIRGTLENISLTGALVKCHRNLSGLIHLGDTCTLLICHQSSITYSKYTSKVARLGSEKIGLLFCIDENTKKSVTQAAGRADCTQGSITTSRHHSC